ncbi:MAG: hypothetical protein IKC01_07535, partial [Clostridia bacterium]|nr:hypothetical protein [Clostridia bacterium]
MKTTLKRVLCSVLVLVFMFANANFALAGEYIEVNKPRLSPTLHKATRSSTVDITEYVGDTEEFQQYIFSQIMTDVPVDGNGNI